MFSYSRDWLLLMQIEVSFPCLQTDFTESYSELVESTHTDTIYHSTCWINKHWYHIWHNKLNSPTLTTYIVQPVEFTHTYNIYWTTHWIHPHWHHISYNQMNPHTLTPYNVNQLNQPTLTPYVVQTVESTYTDTIQRKSMKSTNTNNIYRKTSWIHTHWHHMSYEKLNPPTLTPYVLQTVQSTHNDTMYHKSINSTHIDTIYRTTSWIHPHWHHMSYKQFNPHTLTQYIVNQLNPPTLTPYILQPVESTHTDTICLTNSRIHTHWNHITQIN